MATGTNEKRERVKKYTVAPLLLVEPIVSKYDHALASFSMNEHPRLMGAWIGADI